MKLTIILAAMFLTFFSTPAESCSCLPTTLKKSFFSPFTKVVVKAKVIAVFNPCSPCTAADQGKKRFFLLRVMTTYKGCAPKLILVSSNLSSAACGINLQKKVYIFPLPHTNLPMINSCMFIRRFNTLSASDVRFLETRWVCCGRNCSCVKGTPLVNCFRQPCGPPEKACCKDASKCVDNYCGGCGAEWFTEKMLPACVGVPGCNLLVTDNKPNAITDITS